LIYAPSEPVWLDRAANVQITPAENGFNDILSWQVKRSMLSGNRYEVRAEIGNPDLQELRAAPAAYPQWVQEHYFEVPDSIRQDIQALARKITAGQDNPYDKAAAITNYLRINLQYSTSLPPAPEGRDPIEWVLFDYKKGFCNYYASAEVLMLRSVGVPARLAVGFAQGEVKDGAYIVRRRDAHAWPEVFFPGLGWVEFEPTTSQQPLVRSDSTAQANPGTIIRPGTRALEDGQLPGASPSTTPITKTSVPFGETLAVRVLLVALCLTAIALLVYMFYRYRLLAFLPIALSRAFESSGMATPAWIVNWLSWNRLEPVEQAFAPVNWGLRWLGKAPPVHATPAERATTLKKLLPLATQHIEAVASQLEIGLFSPQPADVTRARREGFLVLVHTVRARLANLLGI
jgi:transglutaminase-like putative cysteine protease